MKGVNGKAIKINSPDLMEIDFYGLRVLPMNNGHGEAENDGEKKFQELNPTFIHWPVTFYFSNTQYTPDFYDPEAHTFYEIVGTATRYYQGQSRMLSVRRLIGAKIVLCNPKGERFIPRFQHRGKSTPINKMKTIGKLPISEYLQDDYGKTSYAH